MAGFGLTPIGLTPFGLGTPEGTQAPPDTKPEGARFINYRTKDYERAANGELKRMPVTRHRVQMVLSTTLGSSSVLSELGIKLPDRIDSRYPQLAEQAIRKGFKRMVDRKEIRILFVRISRTDNPGRVDHVVGYMDLSTGNSDTVTA